MRIQGLASSLVFGAVASVGLIFAQHVFAPFLGSWNVLALYLAGSTIAYSALIGRVPRASWRNAIVASIGSAAILMLARSTGAGIGEVAVGLTCLLALVRSGIDPVRRRSRAIVTESILGGASLAFAAWLAWPGSVGSAAGIWGCVLVQSLYFLIPVARRTSRDGEVGDPFDRARVRLLAMLEEA